MKTLLLSLMMIPVLFSCVGPPMIYPSPDPATTASIACDVPFPDGRWQFLHTIEARMPGGSKGVLMGVTVISSHTRSVRCVIMTVEGLVLFEAEYDRQLVVHRGIEPFDSPEFARGLMEDIRLIFFRPRGAMIDIGRLKDGARICRYQDSEGRVHDTIIHENSSWELRQYDYHRKRIRTVRAVPSERSAAQFPQFFELTAHGNHEYQLTMTLVEAIRIDP